MVNVKAWRRRLSALAIFAISAPIIAASAVAQSPEATESIATPETGSLVGQTRCAKLPTAIFAQRSATSAVVRSLTTNQRVTLSENVSQNGFIGISAPTPGFVQTATLRICPTSGGSTTPPASGSKPSGSTCRRVASPQGLLIRQGPSSSTALVGSVDFNQQVSLTTDPPTTKIDSQSRIWVQINKPLSGWITNGLRSAPSGNLTLCK